MDWEGKHRIFFNGAIVVAPDAWKFILTILAIILVQFLFIYSVTSQPFSLNTPTITVVSVIFLFLIVPFGCKAAFTDPGLQPRRKRLRKGKKSSNSNPYYCQFCQIDPPVNRTLHCRFCDACVTKFDHHVCLLFTFLFYSIV